MKKSIQHFAILFTLLAIHNGTAYSANELFRSVASGNWDSTSTWEMSTNGGGTWFAATITPDNTSNTITVQSPNTVTVTVGVNADQLVVDNGGQISIDNTIILTILDGSGNDLTLNSGGTISGLGTLQTQGSGTVIDIVNGSSFNAHLRVNTGTTNSVTFHSVYSGGITVDSGATLACSPPRIIQSNGNVTNNGTISIIGGGGGNFYHNGASFTNNNTVSITNFYFKSITTLSGTGPWSSQYFEISSTGNVSLQNSLTFGVGAAQNFTIKSSGVLNPNNQTATFLMASGGVLVLENGATASNSGLIQTQGTLSIHVQPGANFNTPLKVNTGTTTSVSIPAIYNGSITVDSGATFAAGQTQVIKSNGNVTNNGIISGFQSSFFHNGGSFINNGSITVPDFQFQSPTTLSGTGTWTSPNIEISPTGNVSVQNSLSFEGGVSQSFRIKSGGVLNPNNQTVTFQAGGLTLEGGSTTSNSGLIQTRGPSMNINVQNGANFNTPLKVNTGTTTSFSIPAIYNGSITVDSGATFAAGQTQVIQANGNVTNNGTITGFQSAFQHNGGSFINNGSVSAPTAFDFYFTSTTTLSGTGTWSPQQIEIAGTGNVSLQNSLTFGTGGAMVFRIKSNGVLNPNNQTATFLMNPGAFLVLENGATASNSGLIQTRGTMTINVQPGANFNTPLKVNTGTTTSSGIPGVYNGSITVDSGATFAAGQTQVIRANGNVTNNGSITGFQSSFLYNGGSFINNGNISAPDFNFLSVTTLSGTGNWSTEPQILNGSTVTLISDHQMSSVTTHGGGTFDISSRTLFVSRSGVPIGVIGTMITTGSTIEYNGTTGQGVATSNLTYNNLTINNIAGVSLSSAETIPAILKLTSGTFSIGGNLTMGNGATIVRHNGNFSGTPAFGAGVHVIYIGTNATPSGTELPSSNTVLKNLTVNNTGGVTLSDARTVNDTLFLIIGTFTNGSNLTLANGSTVNRRAGVLNSAPTFVTNVNVVYSDTAATLTGNEIPASTTILNNLTISNPGGVTLSTNTTANGILTFLNGLLTIGSNTLTLGPSSSVGGSPSNSKMIVASGTGTVRRNFSGTGSFLFPVGDNIGTTEYSPITLNFVSGNFGSGAYAEVNLKNVKQPNNQSPEHYLNRYWTVTQNNITAFSCGVTGSYVDADIVGNELTMWTGSWNGSSWALLNQADAINNQISGTVAGFSDFTGGRKSELGGTTNTFMVSGSFSDHTKWSSEKVPIAGDVAIIAADCVVDAPFPNLSSLTINSGVTLDMATFELPIIATINNNGTIKTQNAGATPLPSGITYSGTIEYDRSGTQTVVNSNYSTLTLSGSGNKNKNGSFIISSLLRLLGGSFSIGANTLTINGGINKTGGTLTGGIFSNITFGGTGPGEKISTGEISDVFIKNNKDEILSSTDLPEVTLNNLTINRASGIGLSGNVTVEGTLDLQSGALSINENTLTINGSINITSGSLVGGTTSNLAIGGSSSQISLQSISLNDLILNRVAGIILNGALTINGALTLTNGDVDLNGQTITLGVAANLAETAGNTVKGSSGSITTTRDLNNITSLNVGGLGAELTTTQNMGSTTITRIHTQQTGDSNVSILRSYDITPTNNTGLNATLVFNYDESELNSITEATLTLFRSTNTGTNWVLRGGTPNTTNNNVTLTGISSLSRWTLGNKDNPLVLENLQLTLLIQGFYNANSDIMVSDTARVYLRNNFSPYSIVDSAISFLSTSGVGTYTFKYAVDEVNYYLQVKHRNSIETWSKFGNSFSSSSLSYNFTTDSAKAFGNNMIRKGTKWCIYNGDVNQDGTVDIADGSLIDNAAYNFASGYVLTDLNGDGTVDIADATIADNNGYNFVVKIIPSGAGPQVQIDRNDKEKSIRRLSK